MPMTSRERIEAALRHQEPDRTPIFEYVPLSPVADALLGRRYAGDPDNWPTLLDAKGWEGAVRQNAIDRVELAQLLGHDMLYVWPNPLPSETAPKLTPFADEQGHDPVERLRRRNQVQTETSPYPPDDCLLVYIYVKQEMNQRGMDLPILAPAYVHGIWTDVDLMQTMLLEPEVAHEHFALATRRGLASIEKYVALGIEQIGVGGDFAGNVLLISPRAYREFIVPEVRRLSRAVHAAGRWAVNASDGNLWPVIGDFVLGCEADGYLEIDMYAGMDLRRLKEGYGSRVTFYGNLDCGNVLSFASPDEIRQHTLNCLEAGWGNGGHILCASNAITASVPLQNYLAVVQAYRARFGLPAFC
jgi:uroporphyrinogen decarboxylase